MHPEAEALWVEDEPVPPPPPPPPPGDDPPRPPPGGGGCPILSVNDGNNYISEGLLDIHAADDVFLGHYLKTTPERIDNCYLLRLTEHPQTISHIDQVQLVAVLSNGQLHKMSLVSAVHSAHGNVKQLLLLEDDIRVDALGADHNNGVSEVIDLQFVAPSGLDIVGFFFFIEGNNAISKT